MVVSILLVYRIERNLCYAYSTMTAFFSRHKTVVWVGMMTVLIAVSLVVIELLLGRQWWGVSGEMGLWSGDISSSHNSQFLFDPYSFTHIVHGLLFYALLSPWKKASMATRFVVAMALEAGWEIIENTDAIIELYRAATVSQFYYGDSIVNSLSDLAMCAIGFALAFRLPTWVSVGLVVLLELVLAYVIRDGLFLNILMLIYPLEAIKQWQMG